MAERILQWQHARYTTAGDTLLTDYKPADFDATVQAKAISVHPHTAIALRCFATDANDDTLSGVVISGWMHPLSKGGCGPGHRLWIGNLILGGKTWTGQPISNAPAGTWPSAAYFEIDTWTSSYNPAGAVALDSSVTSGANKESILILPTLGYTQILIEIPSASFAGAGEANAAGFMWRGFGLSDRVLAL